MLNQLKFVVKIALGRDQAGNRFTVYPDDTFLVSYPKSGNTWVRFLLANLIYPNEDVGFANINRLLPSPDVLSRRFLRKLPRPRILKSHQPYDLRFRKVLYLVRDPRDVVISEYHFNLKKRYIAPEVSLEQFAERFLAGETSSYGSWWEHTASWIAARQQDKNFILFRYEDLLANPIEETQKIAAFLGINATPERLRLAVERSSADRMRNLEKRQFDQWTGTKNTRAEIPFVRSAKAGGWKESLPPQIAEQIESAWSPMLEWLGYEVHGKSQNSVILPIRTEQAIKT
ncbi:MAG TPA: sulfotransferase domain-containing protein [Candidatus Sulfotelmatobacter sp.]|nr:sulfotransferase domain-containing protein [Candidatus Sulfotelmatobacter sp.]